VQIVPANQRRDLPDLVGLRLTLLHLEVHELAEAGASKDSMAPSAADLPKPESQDERYQVAEVDVADVAPAYAFKEPRRLHVGKGNDAV
jgi:hypothetical protein